MNPRNTIIQQAQAAIKKQLLEGAEAQFFRGWGDNIVCKDPGDLLATRDELLAGLKCGLVVEVLGGPAPGWGTESWDAQITVMECPSLNRPGDGKTADTVMEAILRAFLDGGAFHPDDVALWASKDRELYGWTIAGTTTVAMLETPNPGGTC